MFCPGQSITLRFHLPFSKDELTKIVVTFTQDDYFIISKTLDNPKTDFYYVSPDQSYIDIKFTQEQSLRFEPLITIKADINVYSFLCTSLGQDSQSRFRSKTIQIPCGQQFYNNIFK